MSLCVCMSGPVATTSGLRNPQEGVVSFFTVTGSGLRAVAPGLQTNSVWFESLSLFFILAFRQPQFLKEQKTEKTVLAAMLFV